MNKIKELLYKLEITDLKSFKAFASQFIKFGIVGVSNTVVHLLVYYALLFIGVHYIICNILGFTVAVLNSFFWNRNFVFKKKTGSKSAQLFKVFIVNGFIVLFTTTLLFLWVDIIGISEMIGPIINMFFSVPLSFILNKYWAYRDPKER